MSGLGAEEDFSEPTMLAWISMAESFSDRDLRRDSSVVAIGRGSVSTVVVFPVSLVFIVLLPSFLGTKAV